MCSVFASFKVLTSLCIYPLLLPLGNYGSRSATYPAASSPFFPSQLSFNSFSPARTMGWSITWM